MKKTIAVALLILSMAAALYAGFTYEHDDFFGFFGIVAAIAIVCAAVDVFIVVVWILGAVAVRVPKRAVKRAGIRNRNARCLGYVSADAICAAMRR